MELKITIPSELEPVIKFWEAKNGITMSDWLTSIVTGNLKAEAELQWREEQSKIVTLDTKVKAVDWLTKTKDIGKIK